MVSRAIINNHIVDDSNWKIVSIVREIIHLSGLLDWISFCHILREWNGVADILEKWALEKGASWDISSRDDILVEYGEIFDPYSLFSIGKRGKNLFKIRSRYKSL